MSLVLSSLPWLNVVIFKIMKVDHLNRDRIKLMSAGVLAEGDVL